MRTLLGQSVLVKWTGILIWNSTMQNLKTRKLSYLVAVMGLEGDENIHGLVLGPDPLLQLSGVCYGALLQNLEGVGS